MDLLLNIELSVTLREFPPAADQLPVGRLICVMATCVMAQCDSVESKQKNSPSFQTDRRTTGRQSTLLTPFGGSDREISK